MNQHNWQFTEIEATRQQAELFAIAKQCRLEKLAQTPQPSLIQWLFVWLTSNPTTTDKTSRRIRLQNSRSAFRQLKKIA